MIGQVKQKITNKVQQSSKQKAQKAQAGGPTIGGVAGVGKQKTVTRPNSSRRPTVVHGHTTGPSATGVGEEVSFNDEYFQKKAEELARQQGKSKHHIPKIKENLMKNHKVDMGEGKENEFTANRQMTSTVRGKMATKLVRKPSGMNDYYAHNDKKTSSIVKEDGGGAPAMSVAGGAVPSITNPTVNYAFQVRKKVSGKMARRKKVK